MQKKNSDNLISLTDAAKTCKYSQEYLSLRARQGKLKAEKIGRNWLTKQEWLNEYLQRTHYKKLELKPIKSKKKLEVSDRVKNIGQENRANKTYRTNEKRVDEFPENLPVGEVPEIEDRGFSFPYFAPSFRFAFAFAMVCVLLFTGTVFSKPAFLPMRDSLVNIKNSLQDFELRDTPIPVILSVAKDPLEMFRSNATGFFAPFRGACAEWQRSTQNDIIGGLEDVSDFTRRGFAHINETFVSDVSQSKEDVKNMFRLAKSAMPEMPEIAMPRFAMPEIEMPTMPEFSLPEFAVADEILRLRLRMTDGLSVMADRVIGEIGEIGEIGADGIDSLRLTMTKVADDAYLQIANLTDQLSLVGTQAKKTFYAVPEITLTELLDPEIAMPTIDMSRFRDFEMPTIAMPTIEMPSIVMPEFSLPEFAVADEILRLRLRMTDGLLAMTDDAYLQTADIKAGTINHLSLITDYSSSITDQLSLITINTIDQLSLVGTQAKRIFYAVPEITLTELLDPEIAMPDATGFFAPRSLRLSEAKRSAQNDVVVAFRDVEMPSFTMPEIAMPGIYDRFQRSSDIVIDTITDQLSLVGTQAKRIFYAVPEITLTELLDPEIAMPDATGFFAPRSLRLSEAKRSAQNDVVVAFRDVEMPSFTMPEIAMPTMPEMPQFAVADEILRLRLRMTDGLLAMADGAKKTFYAVPEITLTELLDPEITMPEFNTVRTVLAVLDDAYQGVEIFVDNLFGGFDIARTVLVTSDDAYLQTANIIGRLSLITDYSSSITNRSSLITELLTDHFSWVRKSAKNVSDNAYLYTAQVTAQATEVSTGVGTDYFSWVTDKTSEAMKTVFAPMKKAGETASYKIYSFQKFALDKLGILKQKFEPKEQTTERAIVQQTSEEIEKELQELAERNEEFAREIERLEQEGLPAKQIITEITKEIEVSKITKVEPIIETTKQTIITKIDDEELEAIKIKLAEYDLWGKDIEELRKITKKLQSRPAAVASPSAPIYIASQGLQVGGHGNFDSIGASGAGTFGNLSVGGSTYLGSSANDRLTVVASSIFDSPITINNSLAQTGGGVSFAGNVDASAGMDITGADFTVGGTNFVVDVATGNVTVGGNLTVVGAQTYSGAADFTANSAVSALSVNQQGAGNVVLFQNNGADAFVIAHSGQLTITSDSAPQFTLGYDATNFLTVGCDASSNITFTSLASLYHIYADTGEYQLQRGADVVFAINTNGSIDLTPIAGQIVSLAGPAQISEAALNIASKVAEDLLFRPMFDSRSLTGTRGQVATYTDDTDNIPIFNLVQDAAEMASGGRAYTTITGTDNESLSYPTAGNIDADDGTISLWYSPSYASTVAGDKYIFHTQDHLQIYYNGADDKFYCQAYNGTNYTTAEATSAAQTFAANDWLHILCAYDNNHGTETVKLYVNNVKTTDTDTWTAQPLPANMFIGSDISANNQSYGKISDFTIFNRVLTRAEVQQIYYLKQPIQDYAHTTTPYANTATVGKYGADYTTISAALTALAGTSDQPALIQVMPGVYQEAITLEDYVDIIAIGGPEVTTIQQATSTIITAGADNCRLQGFTINKTTDDAVTAISLLTYSPTLENLIITGAGVATQTAIDITSGSPQIENIRISNVNTAITTGTGSPTIINAKIGETTQVATGVKHTGTSGTTTVRYSMISSTTDDIYAFGNGATIVSSNNILQSTTNNFETEIGATIESSFDNYNSTDSDGFLYDLSDTTVYTEANNDVDVGTAVYLSAANTVNLAKADSSTTMPAIGIVVKEDGTNVWVKSYGIYYEQGANYAVGESYYVSSGSAGAITATKPAGELAQVVGVAISSEELSLTSMSGEIENNSYQNVLTVSPDGGGYATIQAAIDVIVSPTSSNRWLVLVYPGVYDEAITLDEDYTDLIAIAGASVTKVTQADTTALTVTSNNNIIKGFNFDISAGTDGAVVVALNASPASVIFEDSTITWVGAGSATGIAITTGSPYIKRTTISQVAKAITITTGSPTITQSDITATDTGISIATGGGTIALTYNSVNATNDDIIAPSLSSATVINSSNNWLRSSNDNFDIDTNATVNSYKDTYTTINTNSAAGTFNQKDYIRNDTVTALTVTQSGSGAAAQFGDGTDYVQISKSGNITFTNVDAGSTITGPGASSFTIANTGEIILTSDSVETMRVGCPSGYILVPGSSTYSTTDFCVMKYEAKYDKTGDGDGDTEGDCYVDVLYDTWDWGGVGGDCPGFWSRDSVVSTANGSPIAGITQTQSIDDACPTGSHLITNDEWMTIARNAEQVAANWVGGVVGTGCFHRGNTGTGDPCGAAAYNGADPEAGTGRDAKAKLILSNGEELWDLSGNVYEWTNNTVTRGNQPQPAGWNEIAKDGDAYSAITSWTSQVSYADVGPLDTNLNDANGVGRIYSYYSSGSSDVRAFKRGGNWSDNASAGVFTLNLSSTPGYSNYNVGFRCVRDTLSTSTTTLTQISGSLRADDTTFVVDALNNRVGIGTATPTTDLHIAGQCVTGDTLLPIVRSGLTTDCHSEVATEESRGTTARTGDGILRSTQDDSVERAVEVRPQHDEDEIFGVEVKPQQPAHTKHYENSSRSVENNQKTLTESRSFSAVGSGVEPRAGKDAERVLVVAPAVGEYLPATYRNDIVAEHKKNNNPVSNKDVISDVLSGHMVPTTNTQYHYTNPNNLVKPSDCHCEGAEQSGATEAISSEYIEYVRIDEIKGGEMVLSLNEKTGKIEPARIKALMDMGVKPVFKMTTEDGRFIRTTGNHPYLTERGWTKVTNLKAGDKIAVPRADDLFFGDFVGGERVSDEKQSNEYAQNSAQNIEKCYSLCNLVHDYLATNIAEHRNSTESINPEREIKPIAPSEKIGLISALKKNALAISLQKLDTTFNWLKLNNTSITYNDTNSESSVKSGESDSESDIQWQAIKSIEYVGAEQVWDIEVEGTHNFVAGHFVEFPSCHSEGAEQSGATEESRGMTTGSFAIAQDDGWGAQDDKDSVILRHQPKNLFFGGIIAHNTYMAGLADVVQLTVRANATQTSDLVVFEQSDGTDVFTVDNAGNVDIAGAIDNGLVAWWPLDEGTGDTIADKSIKSNDAIKCPTGWIAVPGNSSYGSGADFCVMKYEAKYDCTSDGDGDTAAVCSAVAEGGGLGVDWDDVPKNRDDVVSTANGTPIVEITQTEAINDACPTGSHLITNDEWMTIARNAEQVAANWVGGVVGTGCFHRGNTGTGDPCGAAAYNGADPEAGTGRDAKAKLTLSNGEELWDLSGNVYEWTNNTATRGNQPQPAGWNEIAKDGDTYNAITSWTSQVSYADVGPLDTNLNDANGVGRIYSYYSSGSSDVRAFERGGSWSNGAYAGAFTLHLSHTPGDSDYNVGFRCVR